MTRLTFDTFPRSGTMWLAHSLSLAFPDAEIKWGGHRSSTFIEHPNCITSVRSPLDAIPSYLCFFRDNNVDGAVDWYCRFIERTIKFRERVYISRFENLTTDPMIEMRNYAAMFGLSDPLSLSVQKVTDEVHLHHPFHLPGHPTKERKKTESMVRDSARIYDALALYELIEL